MLPTPEYISTFIEQQFPAFYREEGPQFIAFVKAYYEWMESTGKQTNKTRNLFSTRDIDLTADAFVEQFKKKYLQGIPTEIAGDKRFLQKHILDLYRSKGSLDGLKLLFRLLYNEEIQVYIPSYDMLKPSHGKWVEKQYLEISFTAFNYDFNNKIVTGVTSGATAFVESFERTFIDNGIINLFYISNIQGTFVVGEKVIYEGLDAIDAPKILGSPNSITINSTVPDNAIGDILLPSSGNGSGTGLRTIVSTVINAGSSNATIEFKVINGGTGYTTSPTITVGTGSNSTGTGATFTGVTLKNTSTFTYSPTLINYAPYYPITKTFNANTGVSNTVDFISIASNPFANGTLLLYTTDTGNTAVGGLTNNTSYFVITANTSGFRLASNYSSTTATFNALTAVSNTADFITIASNPFANNDLATYTVAAGNTVVVGLANNTSYYVVYANSTGIALANTFGGANINITSTVSETGHTLRLNGQVINLVSGSTQTGHNLFRDQVVRFNANLDVANTTDFISIGNNLFANGDYVTYLVETGNTAITGLTNNTTYYVVTANTTGLKLATSFGGANIDITAGATQNGHTLKAVNVSTLALNSTNFGSSLNNANLASVISTAIATLTTTIGTIDKLTGINPGSGYDGYLSVSVVDPITSAYGQGADAVIHANVVIGTGLVGAVRIFNSGLGYYTKEEDIQLYNSTQANTSQISTATINLGGVGTQEGFWADTRGFLDSNKYIQDSYYYQEFSYEVKTSKALNKYRKILKDVFHPVGNELFGRSLLLSVDDTQQGEISNPQTIYRILGSELAESETFNANTGVSNTTEYITTTGTNNLSANDYVLYYQETGNVESFDANTGVSNTTDYITTSNTNSLQIGDYVQYTFDVGNTVVTGLTYNAKYYVISANSTALQLSLTANGAAINITSGVTETGHNLYQILPTVGGLANNGKYFVVGANSSALQLSTTAGGPAINITSSSRETGHHLVQSVPASGNVVFIFNISRLT